LARVTGNRTLTIWRESAGSVKTNSDKVDATGDDKNTSFGGIRKARMKIVHEAFCQKEPGSKRSITEAANVTTLHLTVLVDHEPACCIVSDLVSHKSGLDAE
jgi:hypothetical protein